MSGCFDGLEPKPLWHYFEMVSKIPRCSGHEERIQAALAELGRSKGLEVRQDAVGNLTLVIPPAAGCETWPTVVLQGHVDMVCEKNNDVDHDFSKDGIEVVRDGDWLKANGTTLGADNGVAVAAGLAMIDDPPARHGQLELLFTVDEERGLTGAAGVEPHMITGRTLLNLDSEEEGFVTVGCAGGGDTNFDLVFRREPLPADWQTGKLVVKGLAGGHSGIDIHQNRANSLRCMGRLLDRIRVEVGDLRLISLSGGSKRNAIPREAQAELAVPRSGFARVETVVQAVTEDLRREFGPTDPHLKVEWGAGPKVDEVITKTHSDAAITILTVTPTGVLTMNRDIPGLIETSTNLGVAEQKGDHLRFVSCSRSSIDSALEAVRQSLRVLGEAAGARVSFEASYPGWAPNLESELLEIFKRVHQEVTGKAVEVMAIHAGLECGILGERFPGMDMISIGPDLDGVHSPDERLSIPSTQRFYRLLKKLIEVLQ